MLEPVVLLLALSAPPSGHASPEVDAASTRRRVHAEVREMMRTHEGRVRFTDLWSGDRLSADEKEYAARLYEVFFALPALVRDELKSGGALPSLAVIAAHFDLTPDAVDLLLSVMTTDPRMPRLFRRDPRSGEIADVDAPALEAFLARRGSHVRVSGWEGEPFPAFSLPGVFGGTVSSAELEGHPVLVFLWLTRCPVCRRVTPSVVELHRRFAPRGLRIVGLNADDVMGQDVTPTERQSWLREQEVVYPNASLDAATRSALGQNIFPVFFLVGRDGRVRELVLNERSLGELEALVPPLLEAEPAGRH